MNAAELCIREVVIAQLDETAHVAARRMREHHVGDLVVVQPRDGRNHPVGIVTDRDLVVAVLAEARDPREVPLHEVMSRVLVTVRDAAEITAVVDVMKEHGVRRVPVTDADGDLVGILSYDDLVEWIAEEMNALVTVIGREQRREKARES